MIRLLSHSLIAFTVLAMLVIVPTLSGAQSTNEQIKFQGTLNNTTGTPQSGSFDMVFHFYDAPTGGTLLDTSTHTAGNGNAVTVTSGEFEVMLGSGAGNTLDGVDFNTATIYVGLTVGADSEMTPRQRLTSAPYSFNADYLDGYDSTDFLKTNATGTIATTSTDTILTVTQSGTGDILNLFDGGTEVFTVTDGGNVGIGTTSPSRTLTVQGDMELTGALYDSQNSVGIADYVLQSNGSGVEWVSTSSLNMVSGSGLFTDGGPTSYLTSLTDNLVIGSSSLAEQSRSEYAPSSLELVTGETLLNDALFNEDGTKLYTVGSTLDEVRAYDLSVAYDVSSGVYSGENLEINWGQYPCNITMNASSTLLFVVDCNSNIIREYTLSTPGDLSTALETDIHNFNGITNTNSITFNDDGTKFYINNATVYALDLSVPYDLTTAVYNGENVSLNSSDRWGIVFSDDGTKMFTTYQFGSSRVYAYDLSVAFDVSTAVYQYQFDEYNFGWPMFNDDGSVVYFANNDKSIVSTYTLENPYNLSTTTLQSEILVTGSQGDEDITFNDDGTRLFAVGAAGVITVYDLDTPYDTSSWSLSNEGVFVGDVATCARDVGFNFTGTKMYVHCPDLFEYDLSVPFDVRTASYTGDFLDTSGEVVGTFRFDFSASGTRVHVLKSGFSQRVYSYDLATAFDLSSSTFVAQSVQLGTSGNVNGLQVSENGEYLYYSERQLDTVRRYELSTPHDVSTTFNLIRLVDTTRIEGNPYGLELNDTEDRIFFTGFSSDFLYALDLRNEFDRLTIDSGTLDLIGSGISFDGARLIYASTSNRSIHIGERSGLNTSPLATDNVFIGYEAGLNASSSVHDNGVFVGYQAGRDLLASAGANTVAVGYQAGYNAGGVENVYLSSLAGYQNRGDYGAFGGYRAGYSNTGDYGVMFGYSAGENNTADEAILVGLRAGENNQGQFAIAMGSSTGRNNTGDHLIALGYGAGENNTGDLLVAIGQYAGQNNTGFGNNFLGRYAGSEATGPYNDFVGYEAGRYMQSTTSVLLGAFAMSGSSTYQAENNVAVGFMAGAGAQSGASNNILIGYKAADNITTGSNNIVIGYDIDLQDPAQSNTLNIANLIFGTGLTATGTVVSSGNIGIGTSSPTAQLHVTGTVRLANFGAGNLTTDAIGNVSVSSDEQLKEFQEYYTESIEALVGIQPIVYRWNEVSGFETLTEYVGFSAQNVRENIPGTVGQSPDGLLTLSDRGILAAVVNAVKDVWNSLVTSNESLTETNVQLEVLNEELAAVEESLQSYRSRIELLKSEVAGFDASTTSSSDNDSSSSGSETTGVEDEVANQQSTTTNSSNESASTTPSSGDSASTTAKLVTSSSSSSTEPTTQEVSTNGTSTEETSGVLHSEDIPVVADVQESEESSENEIDVLETSTDDSVEVSEPVIDEVQVEVSVEDESQPVEGVTEESTQEEPVIVEEPDGIVDDAVE